MFKNIIILLVLFSSVVACSDSKSESKNNVTSKLQTWRLDFMHSGGKGEAESFEVDELVVEPVIWAGPLNKQIDTLLRGGYLAEVVDAKSGKVLFSRSYMSMYADWDMTTESATKKRSFSESIRFPEPKQAVDIVVKKRNNKKHGQPFFEIWRHHFDPAYVEKRIAKLNRDGYRVIKNNGAPKDKIDLVILGDGFTLEQREDFFERAQFYTDELFKISPFKERVNDWNVVAIHPASKTSGVTHPSKGIVKDSPLGVTLEAFGLERYSLTEENKAIREVAQNAPYEALYILSNTDVYSNGGIFNAFTVAAAYDAQSDFVFVHEFGHHFAGLADEYFGSPVAYATADEKIEPYEPNVTALLDPKNLKWQKHVTPNTPIPTPWNQKDYLARKIKPEVLFPKEKYQTKVGAFEGAYYQAEGYYRPQLTCIMLRNEADDKFCPICAEATEQMMDLYLP